MWSEIKLGSLTAAGSAHTTANSAKSLPVLRINTSTVNSDSIAVAPSRKVLGKMWELG
jgi:hypothetical protein